MRAAVTAGAVMINDVRALRIKGALATAAALRVPVCVMHMQGIPATMQLAPTYTDVVAEVRQFLVSRVEACHAAGIPDNHIVLDPGFGFGKALAHNLELLSGLRNIASLGLPVMAGLSRKGMLGPRASSLRRANCPAVTPIGDGFSPRDQLLRAVRSDRHSGFESRYRTSG